MLTDEVQVELYREALALLDRSPAADPDGMRRAEAEASFAVVLLHYWGEKAEALPMLERAHAARRRVLGEAHPQTLSTLLVLASLQLDDGDYLAAAPKIGALIAGLEKCTARPELLECGRAWAAMLAIQALRGEAAAVAPGRRAVEAFTRVFGPDHYLTVRVRYSLAWLCINSNDRPAALAALRECLAGVERWGPPNRFTRAQIHLQMGRVLRGQGEAAEAVAHLRTAVELFRHQARRPGECRHEYAWALQVLAQTLDPDSQGGVPEAGELLAEAAAYCARPGVDETRRGNVLRNAAWWYYSNGDVARAGKYAGGAVQSWERVGRAGTPDLVACLALHSATLRRSGQEAEAAAAAGRCRDLLGRIPASSDQATTARALLDGHLPFAPP